MEPVPPAGLGATLAKPRRPVIACALCQLRFNSQSQAAAHYQGNRHARRLKGLEGARGRPGDGDRDKDRDKDKDKDKAAAPGTPAPGPPDGDGPCAGERPPAPEQPPAAAAPGEGTAGTGTAGTVAAVTGTVTTGTQAEEEKAKRLLYCGLCKVAVNSLSQLEAHNKGTKHRTILEARSGLGPIRACPRGGAGAGGPPSALPPRAFHCRVCNVRVNSEAQLKQHISSRRHRDGVAGKPNPLLGRPRKARGPPELAALPFAKELPKALAGGGGLLPPPLALAAAAAAAALAAPPPLALRPPGPPGALLPGPPLAPALLRPAPGPLRPAPAPLLFSPY
ncbi:LOW QUALITY PROTEIN: zinc finger protein 385A [Dromaius novaehollandiae]|uniref:LOW QUALITY PROTEIN: zinc finger protein 385A n=1 Tax=Dromaius novaehollandiae TaxID=8790 RepID=UPI00311F9C9E